MTLDAAGCQTAIARQIRDQGGGDLLAVKGNRPTLHEAVQAVIGRACQGGFAGVVHDGHERVEDGHGRHEERYTTVIYDPQGLPEGWPDVAAVVLVRRERSVGGKNASTAHYYLTGLRATAAELGRLVRRHWSVEIELHWVLDMAFGEDSNRTAAGHGLPHGWWAPGSELTLVTGRLPSVGKSIPNRLSDRQSHLLADARLRLGIERGQGHAEEPDAFADRE